MAFAGTPAQVARSGALSSSTSARRGIVIVPSVGNASRFNPSRSAKGRPLATTTACMSAPNRSADLPIRYAFRYAIPRRTCAPNARSRCRTSVEIMTPRKAPTTDDRVQVMRIALLGIAASGDLGELRFELYPLHPKNNTFPGEVLLELAADAIEEAGASRAQPIELERIRERYLPECGARTKAEHHKSKFAIRAAAMIRAGVDPGLLDEVIWWQTDDLCGYGHSTRSSFTCASRRTARASRSRWCASSSRNGTASISPRRADAQNHPSQPHRTLRAALPNRRSAFLATPTRPAPRPP
jgi:hypothetical protein